MRLTVISFKRCWQAPDGRWNSYGGFPDQMHALAGLFDELTLVVTRVAPREGGAPLPETARVVPLPDPPGQGWRRKLAVAIRLWSYLRVMGREVDAADIVHAPVPGDLAVLGFLLARVRRRRCFAMYNNSWIPDQETTRIRQFVQLAMRRAARQGDLMVALAPLGVPGEPAPGMHWLFVSVIHEAELARVTPALDRPPGRPLELVAVGRLSPEKGLVMLLEALRDAAPATGVKPFHLTLVGDGPQRRELEARAHALGLGEAVTFTGAIPRGDLPAALRAMDVCVVPSDTEGFAKSRIDAMACGLPILTTTVGFGREFVGRDGLRGWVIPPRDRAALQHALARLWEVPQDWPALRREARAYAEQYTLERWSARIAELCARTWGLRRDARGRLQP